MFQFDTSKAYPKETLSKVVIRFQDCDPLQHLNNAKYLDYFFNAREDQSPKLYGVEPSDIFRSFGTAWVVYNHQIAYLRPARMGEWVRIKSSIVFFDEKSVVVEYYMMDDNFTELKTVLWSTLRYVDVKSGKSALHQEPIMDYLRCVWNEEAKFESSGFQDRIKRLKVRVQTGALKD